MQAPDTSPMNSKDMDHIITGLDYNSFELLPGTVNPRPGMRYIEAVITSSPLPFFWNVLQKMLEMRQALQCHTYFRLPHLSGNTTLWTTTLKEEKRKRKIKRRETKTVKDNFNSSFNWNKTSLLPYHRIFQMQVQIPRIVLHQRV